MIRIRVGVWLYWVVKLGNDNRGLWSVAEGQLVKELQWELEEEMAGSSVVNAIP